MHLKGFAVEAQAFLGVAEGAAGIAAVEEHKGGEEARGLGRFKTTQRFLMAAKGGVGEPFDVGHFPSVGMALQGGRLLQHFLKAVLAEGLVEVGKPCFWGVVLRPGNTGCSEGW